MVYLKLWLVLIELCAITLETTADIKVGAFNIQIYGRRKAARVEVMATLVKIVQQYDILFIQEIRDSSGEAINQLLTAVNRKQSQDKVFSMRLSKRLGRTSSKEQYALLFREGAGIKLLQEGIYPDVKDEFEREPMIAKFSYEGFVFAVVGLHVDPDTVISELNALDMVVKVAKRAANTNNVLIMGDLNADCSYMPKYRWKEIKLRQNNADYVWHIGDGVDTTIKATHCAYDRIITTGSQWKSSIVENSVAVNRFDNTFGLTMKQAAMVSDHYPIELIIRPRPTPIRIANVYIYLTNPNKSLSKYRMYTLVKNLPNRLQLDVFDGGIHVGTVYFTENELALFDVYSDPNIKLEIKPVSYRYRGRQKADVYATPV